MQENAQLQNDQYYKRPMQQKAQNKNAQFSKNAQKSKKFGTKKSQFWELKCVYYFKTERCGLDILGGRALWLGVQMCVLLQV